MYHIPKYLKGLKQAIICGMAPVPCRGLAFSSLNTQGLETPSALDQPSELSDSGNPAHGLDPRSAAAAWATQGSGRPRSGFSILNFFHQSFSDWRFPGSCTHLPKGVPSVCVLGRGDGGVGVWELQHPRAEATCTHTQPPPALSRNSHAFSRFQN